MKRKDIENLKTRSADELRKTAKEQQDKLWDMQKELREGKLKNVHAVKTLKRDIARALTFLKNK